ncbi:hypothetical protein GCM10027578_15610 [Spirosoma luteolum]
MPNGYLFVMRSIGWLGVLLLLGRAHPANAQVDCQNIGFDEGTTRGWRLTNGSVTDIGTTTVYQNETDGIFENGHRVTSLSDGNDPNVTVEAIPMVAPGSTHSIRIGNVTRGSRFDRLRGSFLVSADNTLFQYQFAVVLQNPTHQPHQQPGFSIRITNQAGQSLSCSEYDVTAAASITGFKAQGDIRYRNWTTGAIDLRAYIGQTVYIEVTAHGCTERRHYGYAYFDAKCLRSEITQALYCPGVDKTMTLKAPDGFAGYRWNTGATTPTIQITPQTGDLYQVKLTPYSSLNTDCLLGLDYRVVIGKPVEPTRQTVSRCEGEAYRIGDSTYTRAGTYLTPIRRGAQQCDSLVQTTLTIRPLARSTQSLTICAGDSVWVGASVYKTSGTFQTRLSRPAPRCDSIVTTQLTVQPFQLTMPPGMLLRPGDVANLRAVVTAGPAPIQYTWSPGSWLSCATCPTTVANPPETTLFTLRVQDTGLGCQRTGTVLVTVSNCLFYAPDAFSPNADGVNDVFMVPANSCVRQVLALTVFNRWGEIMYQGQAGAAGQPGLAWDGTYRGLAAEAGIYAFQAEVDFIDGGTAQYRGQVLLMR